MGQELRDFVGEMKTRRLNEVVQVRDEVKPKYEVTGIMFKAERHGHYPLFIFDRIKESDIPLATGVLSHRKRFTDALGVSLEQATQTYIQRSADKIAPRHVGKAPFHVNVQTGSQVDLTKLPLLTSFPVDPGPYITAALVVTRDPVTGVDTLGYHRCMLKGENKPGISLRSRHRVSEYQERAEQL